MHLVEGRFWTHQKGIEMIEDSLKALQETTPHTSIDASLTLVENLRLLLESFKEHASSLGEKTKQEVEEKLEEKRLLALHDKCALAHTNVEKNMKSVKICETEANVVFAFCLKWPDATQSIKNVMDSIESQLTTVCGTYKTSKDRDKSTWNAISAHRDKFFILQKQKEEIIRKFCQLGDFVRMEYTLVSNALESIEKLVMQSRGGIGSLNMK